MEQAKSNSESKNWMAKLAKGTDYEIDAQKKIYFAQVSLILLSCVCILIAMFVAFQTFMGL